MPSQKIIDNFIGGSRDSNISKVCKAFSLNLYQESQDAQATSGKILRSIGGTSTFTTMPEYPCRGLYRVSRGYGEIPTMYGCFGTGIYVINADGSYNKIGTVSNATPNPVNFAETSGYGSSHPHLVIADGTSIFAFNTGLTVAEQAADFRAITLPLRAGSTTEYIVPTHIAYLYGYLVCNDSGTDAAYLSYRYPFSKKKDYDWDYDIWQTETYGGFGFVMYSEWSPDKTVALASNGSHLLTLGDQSYQIWSWQADENYPLVAPDTASADIGCKAPRSLASVGSTFFWLGSSGIGNCGVFSLTGTELKRISNPDIEREIQSMSFPEDAVAQSWSEGQHVFYALTFRKDCKTFVYDLTEGVWHNRQSYRKGMWRPQYAMFAYGKIFHGLLEGCELIYQDNSKYTEFDGLCIQRTRRGGYMHADHSPVFIDAFKVICNNGNLVSGQEDLEPQVMMRYSWGGTDWSDWEIGGYGKIGETWRDCTWWQLGNGTLFSVEVSCSEPVNFSIIGAKVLSEATTLF